MRQYCRYCVNLVTGNGIYCEKKERCLAETTCKAPNHCREFEYCEIDAFYENIKPYNPRGIKPKAIDNNARLFEIEEDER